MNFVIRSFITFVYYPTWSSWLLHPSLFCPFLNYGLFFVTWCHFPLTFLHSTVYTRLLKKRMFVFTKKKRKVGGQSLLWSKQNKDEERRKETRKWRGRFSPHLHPFRSEYSKKKLIWDRIPFALMKLSVMNFFLAQGKSSHLLQNDKMTKSFSRS